MAWTGLQAAHAAHGISRSQPTLEDKVWMLEKLTGQDFAKSFIEGNNFAEGWLSIGNRKPPLTESRQDAANECVWKIAA